MEIVLEVPGKDVACVLELIKGIKRVYTGGIIAFDRHEQEISQ